jgi:hypothetical protein
LGLGTSDQFMNQHLLVKMCQLGPSAYRSRIKA